jgi:hypothetical protein
MRPGLEIDSNSMRHSQLNMIAMMLSKGLPDQEVVEEVMAATKTAAGEGGRNWSWEDEQRKIRNVILSWHDNFGHLDESAVYVLDPGTGSVIWRRPSRFVGATGGRIIGCSPCRWLALPELPIN